MKSIRIISLLAVAVIASFAVSAAAHARDYVLGEGDLLSITVYENQDLDTSARISGDGVITFPLVGEIKVADLTVREAEQKLTEMLADGYLVNPHVTVFVEEYRSKKVTILGAVAKPGLYELSGNVTLLEIISQAGGLTEDAGDTAYIQRTKGANDPEGSQDVGKSYYRDVNLKRLMEKGDIDANIYIMDGDSIFVTKSGFVYVTGEVKKPGAYKVEEGTTVRKAIALAGGLTDIAAPGRTKLIRKVNGEEKSFSVELSFPVLPDDVISVPESFF